MTLGEKIHDLRTRKNMSQSDLADALGVSRQSVSKWETNASVPELGKLVQMSEVFNISLDELVRGEKPKEKEHTPQEPVVIIQNSSLSTRKTIGMILLGIGIIAFLLFLFLGDPLLALIFTSPLLVCAVICLTVANHTTLWCCWALYVLIYAYLRYATGIRFWWIFHGWLYREGLEIHGIIAWAMSIILAALIIVTGRLLLKFWQSKKGSVDENRPR